MNTRTKCSFLWTISFGLEEIWIQNHWTLKKTHRTNQQHVHFVCLSIHQCQFFQFQTRPIHEISVFFLFVLCTFTFFFRKSNEITPLCILNFYFSKKPLIEPANFQWNFFRSFHWFVIISSSNQAFQLKWIWAIWASYRCAGPVRFTHWPVAV